MREARAVPHAHGIVPLSDTQQPLPNANAVEREKIHLFRKTNERQQRRAALAVPHASRIVPRAAHDAPFVADDDARDRVHVIEKGEIVFAIDQLSLYAHLSCMDTEGEEEWHQRIALLASFPLFHEKALS